MHKSHGANHLFNNYQFLADSITIYLYRFSAFSGIAAHAG
jgi:hypothetical protein